MPKAPICPIHDVAMICPVCIASIGGKVTVKKHGRKQMQEWGKMGGRPETKVKTQKLVKQIAALEKELKRRRKKS